MPIRENKFARRAQERKEKLRKVAHDETPTVDEQLSRLEEDVRRLKVEFDIYFNGASKRPPYDTKSRVETLIKRLADDRSLSFAQRYRYNSVVARFNSFRELWRRTMQEREEGRDAAASARMNARVEANTVASEPVTFVCQDAHRDVPLVRNLYDALVEAKKKCGESVDDLSFPRFHRLVAQQADVLKDRAGCEQVRFSIDVEGGRVSFKAKAEE
ncbi:MAG TPA: MXAN_5187 C-terminal domain-containing protein [Pyrinomonadaceae bacterium]|nr:MXAN_5187 C-terminal domain-containing protein [Pyrinomonadaceae bacterium]